MAEGISEHFLMEDQIVSNSLFHCYNNFFRPSLDTLPHN